MIEGLQQQAVQDALHQAILLGGLVSARMVPIVMLVPFLGGKAAPTQVKMGLALAFAVLVYPSVWMAEPAVPSDPVTIGALLVKELGVGLMLGFVTALVFHAVRMAGRLIDTSRGQNKAMSMVPELQTQASVTGNFLVQLFIVLFLVTGGHRIFLAALTRSFRYIPPQDFTAISANGTAVVFDIARLATEAITLGVLLAFPVIAAILLTNIFLALVNKSAPQINVFFLGMPLKALVGIIVVLLALEPLAARFLDEAVYYLQQLLELIHLLSPN